jgi:hypothetical protein
MHTLSLIHLTFHLWKRKENNTYSFYENRYERTGTHITQVIPCKAFSIFPIFSIILCGAMRESTCYIGLLYKPQMTDKYGAYGGMKTG